MNLAQIKVGDRIIIEKQGVQFEATVQDKFDESDYLGHDLMVIPLKEWPTWRFCSANEVKERTFPPKGARREVVEPVSETAGDIQAK